MNTPLESTAKGWDVATDTYDIFGSAVTEKFALPVLEMTFKSMKGAKILDVATGTGALSLMAAKMCEPMKGTVLATDFSEKMIDALNKKINDQALKNITTKVMDGQALEIEDNSFELVYSLFGLIFFPDRLKGFREMFRILKPNGKAGVVTWTTQNPLVQLISTVMKKLNVNLSSSPGKTIPTAQSLSDPNKFKSEMSEAGFSEINIQCVKQKISLTHNIVHSFRYNPVCLGTVLSSGRTMDEFCDTMAEVIKGMYPDPFELEFEALVGVGTKINSS